MSSRFGEKLEKALKRHNLTVAELSRRTGISSNTLYSVIRRKSSKIDPSVLKKILDNTDITIYDLIDDPQLTAWASWGAGPNEAQNDLTHYVMHVLESEGNSNKKNDSPSTIAVHFDGDEYTPEELEEIRKFAEFVKSKRPKPSDQDE